MNESTEQKSKLSSRILVVAIIVMVSIESWITFRGVYLLYAKSNEIGAESELMHVVFRYVGAIVGSGILISINHLFGKSEKSLTEGAKSFPEESKCDDEHKKPMEDHGAIDDVGSLKSSSSEPSRLLWLVFFGVMAAFICGRLNYVSNDSVRPVVIGNSLPAAAQPSGLLMPPLGSDGAAEMMLNDFANKSPAYRVLIDEDESFREQVLAMFKSVVDPGANQDEIKRWNAEYKARWMSLITDMTNKYTSYADDDTIIANMIATGRVADYFSKNAPDGCKGLLGGDFTHFSEVPTDLMAAMRDAGGTMLISGFRNFKAGKEKKASFTEAELMSFLASKAKSDPNFKADEFLKLYEPLDKTSAQDICRGMQSLSRAAPNEASRTLGKFYRTVLVGM